MFCYKCGSSLSDDALFCNNCGAKVREKSAVLNNGAVDKGGLASERNRISNNAGSYDEPPEFKGAVGSFKWGSGATAWFVIMIIISGFSLLNNTISIFTFDSIQGFMDSVAFRQPEVGDLISTAGVFEGLYVYVLIGFFASAIILCSYSFLFAKKKKLMFFTLIAGYAIAAFNSAVELFIISGRISDVFRMADAMDYEREIDLVIGVFKTTFVAVTVIMILIYAGFVISTYFIIRKNFKKLR